MVKKGTFYVLSFAWKRPPSQLRIPYIRYLSGQFYRSDVLSRPVCHNFAHWWLLRPSRRAWASEDLKSGSEATWLKGHGGRIYGLEEERKHISGLLASKKGGIESSKRPQSSKRKLGFFWKYFGAERQRKNPIFSHYFIFANDQKMKMFTWGPHGDLKKPFWSKFWWSQYLR